MISQETKAPARNADPVTPACFHPSMIIYRPSMNFHHPSPIIHHSSSIIHCPSSIMASFWADCEVILGSFWDHSGIMFGSCWGHFGVTLGSCLDHFGIMLGPLWGHFGVTSGSLWGQLSWPSEPGAARTGRSPERPDSRQNGPRQIGARSEARLEVPPERPERQNGQNARSITASQN